MLKEILTKCPTEVVQSFAEVPISLNWSVFVWRSRLGLTEDCQIIILERPFWDVLPKNVCPMKVPPTESFHVHHSNLLFGILIQPLLAILGRSSLYLAWRRLAQRLPWFDSTSELVYPSGYQFGMIIRTTWPVQCHYIMLTMVKYKVVDRMWCNFASTWVSG